MQTFEHIVNFLNSLIWSKPEVFPFMVVVLLSFGIFITIRLTFIQIRRFTHGVKVVTGYYDDPDDLGDVNHFQALSTALSATVGIGNIAGVAIAIHYGGPGALFWMWVTALLGMAIKFSECTLAVNYRNTNPDGSVSGGPMYYIEKGLGSNWKWLAIVFAVSAVICSFLTGNAVQSNTVADSLFSAFHIPRYITGFVTAGLVGFVILGGIKRIGNVTSRLAPLMALIYVTGAMIILLINYTEIIPTFGLIISSAFSPKAGAFGIGSGAFLTTLVWGIKRGLFSNEAGQGSAPIAHAAAKTDEPVREGVVALLEPFIDTLVICTMTGLVICITNVWQTKHIQSVKLNSVANAYKLSDVESGSNLMNTSNRNRPMQVENGTIQNGTLVHNDYSVDTLFADAALTLPFNGKILQDSKGHYAKDANNKEYRALYGRVVENGAPLTALAFEQGLSRFFPGGQYIVTLCVFLFGISTAISWSYYGDRAIQYLAGDRSIVYYKSVYVIMNFVGSILALTTVWTIGDITLGLMALPNLIALFALSGVVYELTQTYFSKQHALPKD
ncbi:MAG TPA: sodium:alanine symporter family protein [Balneolales bacterium]|nr:sodium:alanine symporter family protein [Balneolales bacterium]